MSFELDLDGAHWRFSLRVYEQPGVADACLLLQDRHKIDVNVLLVALIHAAIAGPPSILTIAAMDRTASEWRSQVVWPLRKVRRSLKLVDKLQDHPVQLAVRQKVATAELAAEQVEQAMLAQLLPAPTRRLPKADDLACTLETVISFYAGQAELALDAEQAVATILDAALRA
ncbi:TIGR02444 family protein [Arboricoccus pini]|uniref:TIGR02444 family protein n=1 Tax=Arboricoccus pini TaxID=1963835 RepID=A0A212R7I8_9PROT|nr:TIGR02444 family protein [Arboricoccus pini]SNB68161.1 TIGR02444 family protein [Arboricoccus pini]